MDEPTIVTADDYEPLARERLPADVFGYYAGGAGDERTLAENVAAWDRLVLRPRYLVGVADVDASTELLGTPISMPILVAPWAFQHLAHPDGELGTARAAAGAGTIMVVSTTAAERCEEVAEAAGGTAWFQLYVYTDRGRSEELLHRVASAGYRAICLTVDFPVAGLRRRDARTGFVLPIGVPGGDLVFDPALSWDDLAWVREHAGGLPLLLKGILTAEDARRAVEAGVDGIVVSNHGGRQLDGVSATAVALPEVVEAVQGRVPVLVDGGIRRGTDVLRGLSIGAAAVLVGRPCVWALAAAGEPGVADVLRILRAELENAMALTGCRTLKDVTPELVAPPGQTEPRG